MSRFSIAALRLLIAGFRCRQVRACISYAEPEDIHVNEVGSEGQCRSMHCM
jgi:hypothetical protein